MCLISIMPRLETKSPLHLIFHRILSTSTLRIQLLPSQPSLFMLSSPVRKLRCVCKQATSFQVLITLSFSRLSTTQQTVQVQRQSVPFQQQKNKILKKAFETWLRYLSLLSIFALVQNSSLWFAANGGVLKMSMPLGIPFMTSSSCWLKSGLGTVLLCLDAC